ncbi:UDP-4-amino-4,6-dideoxy-N-acetyl-beta-L-altrosamine transaminase [Helicobacter pametensis]|uniref:UDP-4-amino-4, 6-dideoxy-N-acetyl-beta-L-altrosamine transaminase n=1 Tax=Helicobacter pametensis TaxID=95149 RepID=UPI00047F2FA3|nr:UDP-4-amino-4,6-dideoxy-N-acetyl-beta-L-altrosamine transaminase [Helicobacter pametensis]
MNPYSRQSLNEADIQAVLDVLKSDLLTQGEQTELFEQELASYLGAKFVLVFNSATSALFSAYRALNLGGTEVITSPLSFVATANMLLENQAIPVFCDIKIDGNIDENKIESLITPKTRAIVSVDYAGKSVEIDQIYKLAQAYDLALISDSSHSFGGQYQGRKIGTLADVTIFSFHALKPMTTGEGGALVTDSEEIYQKAKLIRSHGVVKKTLWNSDVAHSGFNFRLSEFASALGRSQLKRVDDFIAQREKIARFYDEVFFENPYFDFLPIPVHIKSSRHLYPIFLKQKYWCAKESIFASLLERGLGVQVHYKPIHLLSLYRSYVASPLYCAERFYHAELSIPCHQLMSLEDARKSAENILNLFNTL